MTRFGLCLLVSAPLAFGQAAVERTLGTARSTAGAAPARGPGRAVSGVFDSLSKVAGKAQSQAAAPAHAPPKPTRAPRAKRANYADPAGITVGLERSALIEKYGEPTLKVASSQGETWEYRSGVAVTVKEGKVTAVSKASTPKESGAVVVVK